MNEKEGKFGIIIRCVGGLFGVRPLPLSADDELVLCRARGIFRHEKITPLPGDTVRYVHDTENALSKSSAECAHVIDEIMPRTNALIRPSIANLTHIFLAIPAARPTPDLKTADKLISIAEASNIEPIILVTKEDLAPEKGDQIAALYRNAGFTVFLLSAEDSTSVTTLKDHIVRLSDGEKTVIAAFAGVSGAGKSTMMSKLFPTLSLKTGEISCRAERGRQTTRHVELYSFGKGSLFADTPGFSILDFTRFHFFDPLELPYTFREFRPHIGACRYTKCTHTKEEGCAILSAVHRGEIARQRHDSYVEIFTDMKKKPDWQRRREGEIQ